MTNYSKNEIIKLKIKGQSYKQIAERLSLPLGTVKSVLSRSEVSTSTAHACKNCKNTLLNFKGKKNREFCSDACRYDWWNHHRTGIYKNTCPICNKVFETSTKGRKYCSRECYFKTRTKVGEITNE